VTVTSAGKSLVIPVTVWNPSSALPATAHFVEDNRTVTFEAEHYTNAIAGTDASWRKVTGLGAGEGAMFVSPPTAPSRQTVSDIINTSPCLQYDVFVKQAGTVGVTVDAIPTLAINLSRGLRYAVAFDGDTPQIVDMSRTSGTGDPWSRSVLRANIAYTTTHSLVSAGEHVLKVWMVDPGVVLDRFVISTGSVPNTYGGPPESTAVSHGALSVSSTTTYSTPSGEATVYDSLTNQGVLNVSPGTLTISGTSVNNGTLRLYGGAQLQAGGSFTNNGTLDIMTWDGTLPVGFVNNGTLLDKSAVKISSIDHSGNDVVISMQGYAGHNYQLQQAIGGSLSTGWSDVGAAQSGSGSPMTFSIQNALSQPNGFYRVRVAP
jgi:hypothetical protein